MSLRRTAQCVPALAVALHFVWSVRGDADIKVFQKPLKKACKDGQRNSLQLSVECYDTSAAADAAGGDSDSSQHSGSSSEEEAVAMKQKYSDKKGGKKGKVAHDSGSGSGGDNSGDTESGKPAGASGAGYAVRGGRPDYVSILKAAADADVNHPGAVAVFMCGPAPILGAVDAAVIQAKKEVDCDFHVHREVFEF